MLSLYGFLIAYIIRQSMNEKRSFILDLLSLLVSLCYPSKNKAFQQVKKCLVKTNLDQDLPSWSGIDITGATVVAHPGPVLL